METCAAAKRTRSLAEAYYYAAKGVRAAERALRRVQRHLAGVAPSEPVGAWAEHLGMELTMLARLLCMIVVAQSVSMQRAIV